MLNLNFDFNGKTFLRQWWPMVKSLFQQVQSAINGEETARTEADAREASYRQNADQTLLNEIVDETRARTTADHVITDKVGRKMEAYDFGDYNASTGDTQNTINAIAPDGTQIFPSRGAILKFTVTEQNTDRVELPIEGLGYTDPVKPVYVIDYDFVTGHTYLASVTQVMRVTGTVPGPHTVTQIANGAAKVIFDNGDITDGAVTTDKVVDSSVTTTKIADGAVTKVKLGADVPAVAKTGSFNDLTDVPPADADTLGLVELSDTLDNTHDVGGGKAATPKAVYIAYDRARQADNTATANRTAISIINGTDTVEGSTDKKIKDAINAFATQLTNDGTVNTYKEALDWIAAHGSEYTALLGQVNTNSNSIENKVDKVMGKGLSTNDFTDEYQEIVDTADVDLPRLEEFHGRYDDISTKTGDLQIYNIGNGRGTVGQQIPTSGKYILHASYDELNPDYENQGYVGRLYISDNAYYELTEVIPYGYYAICETIRAAEDLDPDPSINGQITVHRIMREKSVAILWAESENKVDKANAADIQTVTAAISTADIDGGTF